MKKKYVEIKANLKKDLSNGGKKDVILILFEQLEEILRAKYGKSYKSNELIFIAYKNGAISKESANLLNMLRIFRNNIIHKIDADCSEDIIGKCIDAVYSI